MTQMFPHLPNLPGCYIHDLNVNTQALTQKYARHARVDTRHQRVIEKKKGFSSFSEVYLATEATGTDLMQAIEGEKEFWGRG